MIVLWSMGAESVAGALGPLGLDLLQTYRWPLIGAGILISSSSFGGRAAQRRRLRDSWRARC